MITPYQEGFRDFGKGRERDENLYDKETDLSGYELWLEGWWDAEGSD